MLKFELTSKFKSKAKEIGFDFIGISKAEELTSEALDLEKFLSEKRHGSMQWLENNFDKRIDPTKLFQGAKSVVSFGLNYYPEALQTQNTYKISKYAYGRDYHKVLKKKLIELVKWLQSEVGDVNARAFVDSAPVMDKAWAKRSGLGWIGKHTNLINRNLGSFFFIGEIITDVEFECDGPIKDYCGTCTKCIDACPTDALTDPYKIDATKCISYLTIELKENIATEFKSKMEDWIFGCDICQDVCPWNKNSKPNFEIDFKPKPNILNYSKYDWENITEEIFNLTFSGSAVKRTKFSGLKRNIDFNKKVNPEENSG
jgi:epoxyqueuosine reductase